ncbi:Tkl protein kinase [Globisporangium polare]
MNSTSVASAANATASAIAAASNATASAANATAIAAQQAAAIAVAKKHAILAYLTHKIYVLQLFLLLGYGIMFFLCVSLICYMRYNRHVAFKGDASAARKIILPAFEPLLWILGATTGVYTLFFCLALVTNMYTYAISKLATEVFYSGRQFVFVIVVVFMLQKSVSIPALRRTVLISFVLSTYTLPIVWYMATYGNAEDFYWVLTISRALLLSLYTYVFIRPPGRATKRTLREFSAFTFTYYALLFTYNEMYHQGKTDLGFSLTYANLLCGSLCPLVIWRVLQADTEHWRGMGQRAVALQSLFRQKHNINEHISSQGLHVLIEMHRKYIIDFAYLELKQRIGVGASAIVFNGILHSTTPVAIKVYTPSDFTEETVAEFSHEAALCGALNHPNIVKFYGMCVCPPTICLVSELCQGSLEDVTCAVSRRQHHPNRQQFLIDLAYMIDAARAVAYIHSFSPAFVHRDIKPANFLVDAENNVKLTDFGESRSLPRDIVAQNLTTSVTVSSRTSSLTESTTILQQQESSSERPPSPSPFTNMTLGMQQPHKSIAAQMTVRGTVDYMAPEIIKGKAGLALYGEAADVYALAITMWDILNPGAEKFPALKNNHLQIFEFVVDGKRPELSLDVHEPLRQVIEGAWHPDPRLRPSAQNVVSILESIQEEVQAAFAAQLSFEMGGFELTTATTKAKYGGASATSGSKASKTHQPQTPTFSGMQTLNRMCELQFVASMGEGIRIGNALMDAGLVHHVKHARGFESSDALYFFDEDNIQLCQPFSCKVVPVLGGTDEERSGATGTTTSSNYSEVNAAEAGTTTSTRRSRRAPHTTSASEQQSYESQSHSHSGAPLLENGGMCACRKFGQRLEVAKHSRRRFRRHHHHHANNKIKAIAEENVLTAKLLASTAADADFDGFDAVTGGGGVGSVTAA